MTVEMTTADEALAAHQQRVEEAGQPLLDTLREHLANVWRPTNSCYTIKLPVPAALTTYVKDYVAQILKAAGWHIRWRNDASCFGVDIQPLRAQ